MCIYLYGYDAVIFNSVLSVFLYVFIETMNSMDHSSQSQGVSTMYRTFDIRTISDTLHSEVVESTCWRAAATRG